DVAYQNIQVNLACTVKDYLSEIFAEGGHGAFALHVKDVVSERADPTQSADWTEFVGFETESLVFEQRYYDDLDACLKQIQEIGEHRIKQSVLTKFIDKGDPPARLWLSPSEQWSIYHA